MDDPLVAMLFAEDLTHFILAEHGFEMPTESGVRKFKTSVSKSRFNSVIGSCVLDIIRSNAEDIRRSYEKLQERGIRTIEAFRTEATISTIFHFRDGYDQELFLNLSAMLIGLSVLYFKDGHEEMSIGASQVLAYVLNFYILQAEFNPVMGYFDLAVLSQKIRRSLSLDNNAVDIENNTADVKNNLADVGNNNVDVENNILDVKNYNVDTKNNNLDVKINNGDVDNIVGIDNNIDFCKDMIKF